MVSYPPPPPPPSTADMETESVASDDSASSDDFVVVIPDCFNLDLPLSTDPSRTDVNTSCDDFEFMAGLYDQVSVTDDVMLQSHDSIVVHEPTSSETIVNPAPVPLPEDSVPVPVPPPEDSAPHPISEPQAPPTSDPQTTPPGTSPRMRRREFVPERVTLREVKDARLLNPLTVATGLVNTVAHLVEGLTIPGRRKPTTESDGREVKREDSKATQGQQEEEEEEEETFVVSESLLSWTCICMKTMCIAH